MKLTIAGGTGTVGRFVVEAALSHGHEVVVLSRRNGSDILTGEGLRPALRGADAVIDVTNLVVMSAAKARSFFETGTRNLLAAEKAVGVGHHIALSIVGIDDIDSSYYAGKLAQERAIAAGDVPYTIARTGQFHEFPGQLLAGMGGPIAMIPKSPIRPVAAREVGAHLVDVAEAGPVGRARDLVGPRDEELIDLVRRQLEFDGIRRRVLGMRLPGAYGKGLASGSLRGDARALRATITFDEWLRSPDHTVGA
ncbi:SDR family oxidoreductase [Microbacterium sp. ASV49]|uniref:NAD(P)H-binding protein n=1 Tax=Microbacterium candidum TaxID=3041922 RepID=A0ABT7N038_9MICO|nr:NAD(P)H-binding protein [Microbacterium sp. ASV49]MDL9980062.1 NAD(P)H-binding protein [Microbacterium sp. ASV49]